MQPLTMRGQVQLRAEEESHHSSQGVTLLDMVQKTVLLEEVSTLILPTVIGQEMSKKQT